MKIKDNNTITVKIMIAVILFLAVISLVWIGFLSGTGRDGNSAQTACIYQDGELLASIPLNEVTEAYSFVITDNGGGYNRIEVRPGAICVKEADCPDGLCVKQGCLPDSPLPIVCLPHRLVIRLRSDDGSENAPDAVAH